jgi:hypothetical protein
MKIFRATSAWVIHLAIQLVVAAAKVLISFFEKVKPDPED